MKDRNARRHFYAEAIPGPMVDRFAEKARETDMYIIFGVPERPKGSQDLYNSAFLVGPEEGYIGKHRKVRSEMVFTDGDRADVFSTRYGKIGIFICADQRFPELMRLQALKGAGVLFQPTFYAHQEGHDIRKRYEGKVAAQRARAMDNGLPLVIANGGTQAYVNNSRIIGPNGQGPEPVYTRATRKEQLLVAEVSIRSGENLAQGLIRRHPGIFREPVQMILKIDSGE